MCFQFGIIGLVAQEFVDNLSTVDPDDVAYLDFIQCGRDMARELKQQQVINCFIT